MTIIIVIAVAALAAIGTVAVVMRRIQEPTAGTVIDRRGREERALLIVDMQTDFVEGNGYPKTEVERKIREINTRAEEARSADIPIATLRGQRLHGLGRGHLVFDHHARGVAARRAVGKSCDMFRCHGATFRECPGRLAAQCGR